MAETDRIQKNGYNDLPVQFIPSPSNPESHVHWNEPIEFSHAADVWQTLSAHSSISMNDKAHDQMAILRW